MGNIAFNTIAVNLLTPGAFIEFDNSRASSQGLAALPHRALLVGQRRSTGTVAAGVPTKITAPGQGAVYFGIGSMLAPMCDAFNKIAPFVELWAVALDDVVGGAYAGGVISLVGPATAAGTLCVYIGGKKIAVGVASADTAITIAAALVAAINADTSLPVTAAVDGANTYKCNLTARHKGVCGNSIDVRVNYNQGDALPTGLAPTITAMNGGTTNPDITAAIAALGDVQYTSIVNPYVDSGNLTVLGAELDTRWDGMHNDDGQAFSVLSGTYSAIDTVGAGQNRPHIHTLGQQASPDLPWVIAARLAAVDENEPDPARPRQTLPIPGMLPPAPSARYTRSERQQHLVDGVATYTVDAGGICRIERLVTNYKTDANGVPDPSYRDIETMRTLSALRYTTRARFLTKYPRCKLGADGSIGPNVVTPSSARGEMIALYQDWMAAGWVQGGEWQKYFNANVKAEIDATNKGQLNVFLPPKIMDCLRILAGQVQFL